MNPKNHNISLLILLFSGFIDYVGVAIVYPLFAYILFEPSLHFVPENTPEYVRGLWLGTLIAIYPLCQFIFAPIFGAVSDLKGRKKLLRLTFAIALLGYAIAYVACIYQSIYLLALYRLSVGIAAGNCSIVGAIIADVSPPDKKARNYGFLTMAFGAGFTFGPFLSGVLAHTVSLSAPFLVAFWLVFLNLFLISWKLIETNPVNKQGKIGFFTSISQIRIAMKMPQLRFTFLALFVFSFGWALFTEFIALFLIHRYQFTPATIGLYYGYTGFFYAFSAGVLIYPIIRRIKVERAIFLSMLFSGMYLILFVWIKNSQILWIYLPLYMFFLAFVYPCICTVISDRVSEERQGEVMGIYQAVIALALAITPFCSGFFVGDYPYLVIVVSSIFMILAALITFGLRDKAPSFDAD